MAPMCATSSILRKGTAMRNDLSILAPHLFKGRLLRQTNETDYPGLTRTLPGALFSCYGRGPPRADTERQQDNGEATGRNLPPPAPPRRDTGP